MQDRIHGSRESVVVSAARHQRHFAWSGGGAVVRGVARVRAPHHLTTGRGGCPRHGLRSRDSSPGAVTCGTRVRHRASRRYLAGTLRATARSRRGTPPRSTPPHPHRPRSRRPASHASAAHAVTSAPRCTPRSRRASRPRGANARSPTPHRARTTSRRTPRRGRPRTAVVVRVLREDRAIERLDAPHPAKHRDAQGDPDLRQRGHWLR